MLQNGSRKVLACPKCGKAHAVSGGSKSSAVPQNLALVDSLRRLQLNPTLGGLLVVENVHITAQQINTSSNSAVFVSLLQLQSQQLQVSTDTALLYHMQSVAMCSTVRQLACQ